MKNGTELIADERKRQIEVEGYNSEHDKNEDFMTLTQAAISYCIGAIGGNKNACLDWWPWRTEYFKHKNIERDLVRAGALIAAALDRLHNLK